MHLPKGPRELGLTTKAMAVAPRHEGGLGLSRRAVEWRLEVGHWQRLHHGVYLTRTGPVDWVTRAAAALLAYGPSSALAGPSAGVIHGLVDLPRGAISWSTPPRWLDPIHVVVPATSRAAVRSGTVLARRSGASIVEAWPRRTTYDATVVDLAMESSVDEVAALIGKATRPGHSSPARLRAEIARRPTATTAQLIDEMLTERTAGAEWPLEVRFVRDVLRAHGLPEGEGQAAVTAVNTTVESLGRTFDRIVREFRVAFELHGDSYHQGARRSVDRAKARAASRAGWVALAYGWSDAVAHRCESAVEIAETYVERGWPGRPQSCSPRCTARLAG